MRAERDAAAAERDQALSQMDRPRHLLRQLQRAQFGRHSEKLDPEQLLLALEDIEQAAAGNEAADDKKDALAARARGDKCRLNRGALPARGLKLLDHYRGIVQCDGCAAYKTTANAACDEAIIRRVAITQADPKD